MNQGMIDEVKGLMDAGVSTEFLTKLGLEYRYITEYLLGKWTYDQMLDELARAIKRFAKRQMTWFRKEENLHWLDMSADPVKQAVELIDAFLKE